MYGKVIKGVGGSFIVRADDKDYICSAKGAFRYQRKRLLIGDDVKFDPSGKDDGTANIVEILPRKNELIRPLVSNVDQAVIEFAAKDPVPSNFLLDKFLIQMEYQKLPVIICINKIDLLDMEEIRKFTDTYEKIGYQVIYASVLTGEGIDEIRAAINKKTTVWAGPSGVGKSSIINLLAPEEAMETGEISQKIRRGKNTTRHVQLLECRTGDGTGEPASRAELGTKTYVCDTPGFSNIDLPPIECADLQYYFKEFGEYARGCRFADCAHLNDWDCAVRKATLDGKISRTRYEDYKLFYADLKSRIRY